MEKLIGKAETLIEALPYIQEFRNAIVVIKLGGSVMENPERIRTVLGDVVFMECAGMRPLVLHGGGKAISARLQQEGVETRFVHGLRHTCDRAIEVVDDVLHNTVNATLVQGIREHGGKGVAVSGKNVLRAERIGAIDPTTGREEEIGHVGRVINVDTEQILWILNRGEIPVLTPMGRDMNAVPYNINADMAACEVAGELAARKLVFLSDVPGILRSRDDERSLISTVTSQDACGLIEEGVISGGMVPKIRSALRAIERGTQRVHMIDGRVKHALLLEIFTNRGIGTMITA